MMKEPELEEEALTAQATGQTMRIQRRTLSDETGPVVITDPSGNVTELPLTETSPGVFESTFEGPEIGLYRLENGDQSAVIGLGPAAPREFEQTIATGTMLARLYRQLALPLQTWLDGDEEDLEELLDD